MQVDASGALLNYLDPLTHLNGRGQALPMEGYADGAIAWGRWGTATIVYNGVTYNVSGLTYVVGAAPATPPIQATFNAFGSTAPMATNGTTSTQVGVSNAVTGTIGINFTGSTGGNVNYNINVSTTSGAAQTFNLRGSGTQSGNNTFIGGPATITSTLPTGGCTASCNGSLMQGLITGPAGSLRVGGQYGFTSSLGFVSGAVVFK
jgi:hypothetical protein